MVKDFAVNAGSPFRSLVALGAGLATAAAVIVGAVLAVFAAATVAVIAVMASALLAFAGLAMRARRTVRTFTLELLDLLEQLVQLHLNTLEVLLEIQSEVLMSLIIGTLQHQQKQTESETALIHLA